MNRFKVAIVSIVGLLLMLQVDGFASRSPTLYQFNRYNCLTSLAASQSSQVNQLLQLVEKPLESETVKEIRHVLPLLKDNSTSFDPLLGNYNVSCTLPTKDAERPVGGKWNKLARLDSSWQHILPAKKTDSVAQVINMIVLKLFNVWTIHVILRGDAFALTPAQRQEVAQERGTPGGLSPRTVRADFDSPRIVVSGKRPWVSLSLGPKSNVVLDTPYCDDRIRIGKGSRGSFFVFVRTQDVRADDYKSLLEARPLGKRTVVGVLGASVALLWWAQARFFVSVARAVTMAVAAALSLTTLGVAFSTGGIEKDPPAAPSP